MSDLRSSSARRAAILWIVLANVVSGLSYPAQKAALAGLPPATVTCLRTLVALGALLVFLRWRGTSVRGWSRADLQRAFWLGTVAFALPMWLGIVGVERSSSANASILILLEPVTIVAIAGVLLRERIGRAKLAGLVLGIAGALAIVLEEASFGDLFAGQRFAGNAILVLHGVLWGCYTPLAKPLSERRDPLALCLWTTVFSLLLLVPAALAERPRWHPGPELVPALGWSVALGLLVSFASVVLWLGALRHIPATSVAGFVFLQPLAGVLAGVLFLGERLTGAGIAGGILILSGVALDAAVTASRGREERAGVPEQQRVSATE